MSDKLPVNTEFPQVVQGVCPICGGFDQDQSKNLTSADAPARDLLGDGTELFQYEGRWICRVCLRDREQNKKTAGVAVKIGEDMKFRAEAGFIQNPQDGNFDY